MASVNNFWHTIVLFYCISTILQQEYFQSHHHCHVVCETFLTWDGTIGVTYYWSRQGYCAMCMSTKVKGRLCIKKYSTVVQFTVIHLNLLPLPFFCVYMSHTQHIMVERFMLNWKWIWRRHKLVFDGNSEELGNGENTLLWIGEQPLYIRFFSVISCCDGQNDNSCKEGKSKLRQLGI